MAGAFSLKVVAPTGEILNTQTELVQARSETGDLAILPHHAPLIASLEIEVIKYRIDGEDKKIATSGGFMEVSNNQVTILADTAELDQGIDVARAMAAKRRAEQRLESKSSDVDILRAEIALKKALMRLLAAKK
ncbi:MAG: F0F1 ATP synthase subunit epsilon [Anaerofustis sp.]